LKTIAAIVLVASVTQAQATVTMNVVIAANGTVSVDGHAVKDDDEIADRARDAVRRSADVRAVIAADKTVPYGRVIGVMDALKRGGIAKIAFAVAPP
jgi:biopolymer transport protein ExbD